MDIHTLRSPRALEIFGLLSLDLLRLLSLDILPFLLPLSLLPFPAKDPCFAKVCEPLQPVHRHRLKGFTYLQLLLVRA